MFRNYILSMIKSPGFNSGGKYAFHPIRGKPSISWLIQSLNIQKQDNLIIIIKKKNPLLNNFLRHFKKKLNIKVIKNRRSEGSIMLTILQEGLSNCDQNLETVVISGDTVILEQNVDNADTILTSTESSSSSGILVKKKPDNYIEEYFQDSSMQQIPDTEVLIGRYNFKATSLLIESVDKAISEGKKDFTSVLINYQDKRPLKVCTVNEWFDFGRISSIIKFGHEFFNVRSFNEIKIHTNNIIEKSSKNKVKLKHEEQWYKSLPSSLQGFVPRIIHSYEDQEKFYILLEMYGYSTLSEAFVYGKMGIEEWKYVVEKLFSSYQLFRQFTIRATKENIVDLYKSKTYERLQEINRDPNFSFLLNTSEPLIINGISYKNYTLLKEKIYSRIEKLIENCNNDFSIVHGDLCFSNILFDSMNYSFKFIDPRGATYGDARYDIAKLRHSIVGLYDFIVLSEYHLEEISECNFELDIFANRINTKLGKHFDEVLTQNGFNLEDVSFIEALLFLTMIPLHDDDLTRQKAFYLIAIKKLNNIFYA